MSKVLVERPVRVTTADRATITGTLEQVEVWRRKRKQLGVTDAQLLSHVLPMLDQIQGVR